MSRDKNPELLLLLLMLGVHHQQLPGSCTFSLFLPPKKTTHTYTNNTPSSVSGMVLACSGLSGACGNYPKEGGGGDPW